MATEESYKEVYYNQFCESCVYKDVPEGDDPCNECLTECVNLYSHTPTKYEAKE